MKTTLLRLSRRAACLVLGGGAPGGPVVGSLPACGVAPARGDGGVAGTAVLQRRMAQR